MLRSYEIIDPRPAAAAAKYTYFLPSRKALELLAPNDFVKLCIRAIPSSDKWEAERMWIKVDSINIGEIEGTLENDPSDMPLIPRGSKIVAPLTYVLDVKFEDNEKFRALNLPVSREYWERCFVDPGVLEGKNKVDFIYREQPEPSRPNDNYPDSGWRIRGYFHPDEITSENKAMYVALGAVLNKDDSWLQYLDEPIGSAFKKDRKRGIYVRVEI